MKYRLINLVFVKKKKEPLPALFNERILCDVKDIVTSLNLNHQNV